jgi:hypothetical protein
MRSRASSTLPCHSRCWMLSTGCDGATALLVALSSALQHRQPHGDVEPIDHLFAVGVQICLDISSSAAMTSRKNRSVLRCFIARSQLDFCISAQLDLG